MKKLIWLFLFLTFASFQSYAVTDEENEKNNLIVPSLPNDPFLPEQEKQADEIDQKLEQKKEENASAFFYDNAFNEGHSPFLNFLELQGYFRVRMPYFRNPNLGTFIPYDVGKGTSLFPPNLSLVGRQSELEDPIDVDLDNDTSSDDNPAQNKFSGNMRFRLEPTINITEVMKIKSTIDVFDNLVMGSTSSYMGSKEEIISGLASSQNAPLIGVNSKQGAISVKRLWGEATFPIGELKFGRIPFHWGLGVLFNSNQDINSDHDTQVDGVFFATRLFDHYIMPGYSIAYTGPVGRGGGDDFYNNTSSFLPAESGQRYPLENKSLAHVFYLSFLNRKTDYLLDQNRKAGKVNYQYGILSSFRTQNMDSQYKDINESDVKTLAQKLVKRNLNLGSLSLWQSFNIGNFFIAGEFVGHWGRYTVGDSKNDLAAIKEDGSVSAKNKIWILSGGFAIESNYNFLKDRLQLGLDGGLASAESGAGMGIRPGANQNPTSGSLTGKKNPSANGYKSNFRFNPAYTLDLLMYKEVLGTVSGSYYFKPHLSYFFSKNFGVRGDVITSFATLKENTPGNSRLLGIELDANTFIRTDSGFYFSFAYGVLFPMAGLNHLKTDAISAKRYKSFGTAKTAQTLQVMLGLTF